MPKIRLSDAFGLNVDGSLAEGANLRSILPRFAALRDLPLDLVPVSNLSVGLAFDEPIEIPGGGALRVGASGQGKLAILGASQRALDEDDPFGAIPIAGNEIYLALSLDFSVAAGAGTAAGPASFGFDRTGAFGVKCYRGFQKGDAGFPAFAEAFGAGLDSFVLPEDAAELDEIPAGVVLVASGFGTFTVSGGASFSTPVQSLASVGLAGDSRLELKAGGSFGVDATLTLTGGYQIRLRRLSDRNVELGLYNLTSRESALSVSARVGVSAGVGGFDLAERLIGALSRQPLVDADEFQKALPGEDELAKERRIAGFENSLRSAVSTKLETSVQAEFSKLRSGEAAWLFEIDLDAATSEAARSAITAALGGDFSALTKDPAALPAGIAQRANLLTRTAVSRQTLRLNVLGILNFLSMAKIAQVSTVERNAVGDITFITDTASASRLRALLLNTAGNSRGLRKMLSENFLIEAVYQVAGVRVLPPGFQARHTYFEVLDKTNRAEMKDNLDIARVLALITPAEVERRLADHRKFGRTTFLAELKYGDEALRRVFLNDRKEPRSAAEYEALGLSALGALIAGDETQDLRRRYAGPGLTPANLWNEMKRQGPANFGPLFGLPKDAGDPRLGVAIADFIAITDWAKAMRAAAAALKEVEEILQVSEVAPDEPVINAAREKLKERLAAVVQETHDHFGDPLGMLMVYLASNQDADKTVLLTGDDIETLEAVSAERRVTHA
jgi:hypothetical protein